MLKMDVEKKYKEARYFLNQVEKLEHSPEEMIYNLNAFLSSSKSITDYYGKELGKNSNKWFKDIESKFPLIEYFRSKRNFVLHEKYLNLNTKTQVNHVEYISASISVSINVYRVDENGVPIIDDNHVEKRDLNDTFLEEPLYEKSVNTGAVANRYYYFEGFPEKSVLELCGQYL